MFQRFTKYWRIRAFINYNTSGEMELAYLDTPANITFTVNSTYYSDENAVNVMLNPDTTTFNRSVDWILVDRTTFPLTFDNSANQVIQVTVWRCRLTPG
jgi:hypothetical protein